MAPTRKQMIAERMSTPVKLMERESIPSGYISPGNSSFLKKLPREIRDKIYDELLIVQRSPEDQDKYNKIQAGLATGTYEYELHRELDFINQDYMLIPDLSCANKGMMFIGKNKGILTANKQIYDEATTTLFGKNIFGAVPQSERIQAFWRCGISCGCVPYHRPCQARPETFAKIKHVHIIVSVSHPDGTLNDPGKIVKNLKVNLQTIVDTFKESGNHLLTLTLRYWSHFGGEFEAVRESLEGPLPRGLTQRPPAMIRHAITGKFHQIKAQNMQKTIFKDVRILESLKALKGVADYVNVRGDLPCAYRDELRRVLSSPDPGPAGKKMRKADAEAARNKPEPSGGLAGLAAEMLAAKPDMTPESRKLYEELMGASTKSPAVMAQIRPEMYGGSMGPFATEQEEVLPQAPVVASLGGIGVLDGKTVFGPVRPPSIE